MVFVKGCGFSGKCLKVILNLCVCFLVVWEDVQLLVCIVFLYRFDIPLFFVVDHLCVNFL